MRCATTLALGSLWPAHARAQSDGAPPAAGLVIRWDGPADCERGEAVQAKVLRLLGGSRHAREPFEVSVTVRRESAKRYVAELETRAATGAGKKRLEGESCDAIALASSVVIALSVDPEASLGAEPEPEPAPPPPPPAAKPTKPAPPAKSAPPPRELIGYVHGSVGVLLRMLGEPSGFVGGGLGLRYRRFGLELGGAAYQSRQVTTPERPQVGAELRLYTGELFGCYAAVSLSSGALEACGGGRVESVSAAAFGVSNPDQASVLILAGLAVLRGRLRATSWLSATLDLGLVVRPFHPTFVLHGVGDVYEIPVVSPFARTGLALEF